jgi:hypothetical protein
MTLSEACLRHWPPPLCTFFLFNIEFCNIYLEVLALNKVAFFTLHFKGMVSRQGIFGCVKDSTLFLPHCSDIKGP